MFAYHCDNYQRGMVVSDVQQGEGWWQASDGKWYAPQAAAATEPTGPKPTKPWWKRWWVIAIAVLVVLGALAGGGDKDDSDEVSTTEPTTTERSAPTTETTTTTIRATTTTRIGNPDVYAKIEAMTDCAELQREFDVAMDNAERRRPGDQLRDVSMAYAKAADTRLEKLGCYG